MVGQGRPPICFFEDFTRIGDGINATTNIDWYAAQFNPSLQHPAVEMS